LFIQGLSFFANRIR